ncbi:hypothetical protein ACU5AX_16450 [Sphingomonas sp. XXL09]|uniref:hypothetical protein n=1 Tax=Sphingomonas sp. XXL09 TaxID=3457787 RepID=UPI00406BBA98
MAEFESLDGEGAWDAEFAADLIGCTLLVGLTFVDHDNRLIRRQQFHGTVVAADRNSGIVICQDNGEEATIAPALDAIEPAQPGIYHLADEDIVVEDPNFTALLTVRAPLRN